jgi:hypothetical protein
MSIAGLDAKPDVKRGSTAKVVLAAWAALLALAWCAAQSDRGDFLGTLRNEHVIPRSTAAEQQALDLGNLACAEMNGGRGDGEIEQLLTTQAPINTHTAHLYLVTARQDLC